MIKKILFISSVFLFTLSVSMAFAGHDLTGPVDPCPSGCHQGSGK